jgi:hypothetical protein
MISRTDYDQMNKELSYLFSRCLIAKATRSAREDSHVKGEL